MTRAARRRRREPGDFALRAAHRATTAAGTVLTVTPAEGVTVTAPSIVYRLSAPGRPRAGEGGRWGLVLGGGGVLGTAWLIGALDALERTRGLDAREADIIVGTSAGSIVGALLASGVSVAEQRDSQLHGNTTKDTQATIGDFDPDRAAGRARPPRPRLRPGSPQLLRHNRGSLRQLPPLALLSAVTPTGRGRLDDVARLVDRVTPPGGWPERFRAVALDYETGRRAVFGDPEAPRAGLSEAVVASCSIPGWFEPVTIQGRRYVDGGTWSATNTDLLAGADLDEVFVLAPMAATAYDTPADWRARVERRIRVLSTRRCLGEARRVNATGTQVTVITPGPEELELWGYNLMHPGRRKPLLESATRTVTRALEAAEEPSAIDSVVDLTERQRQTTGEAEPA